MVTIGRGDGVHLLRMCIEPSRGGVGASGWCGSRRLSGCSRRLRRHSRRYGGHLPPAYVLVHTTKHEPVLRREFPRRGLLHARRIGCPLLGGVGRAVGVDRSRHCWISNPPPVRTRRLGRRGSRGCRGILDAVVTIGRGDGVHLLRVDRFVRVVVIHWTERDVRVRLRKHLVHRLLLNGLGGGDAPARFRLARYVCTFGSHDYMRLSPGHCMMPPF